MSVFFGAEDTKDVVVFVDRLAEVASLLLVPPGFVGVAELAFLSGWRDVAAIL